ncbi:uncharacterized protein LOC130807619 isoform X2 [Amaranthus tricolor]|uniref:uncharacterized protein LOC130807619 isoform X2 n=1 Tax=Amaranthus tricolor TaxID=29722 RepID=UPI002585AD44|nr:uncharacterized protein LOC130807619 isoform X2 [Amaranthus tricolor]
MDEDKSEKSNEKKSRNALGDITNQLGKRKFSLISKSDNKNNIAFDTDKDTNSLKQVDRVIDKLEKEGNTILKFPRLSNEIGLSPLKGGKTYRLLSPSIDSRKDSVNVGYGTKENYKSVLDSIDLYTVKVAETLRESCVLGVQSGESSKPIERECFEGENESQNEERIEISDVGENESSHEILGTQAVCESGGNLSVDRLMTNKCESFVSSRLDESNEMQGFGLERCALLKEDVIGSSVGVADYTDSIKDCSCSFCSKALAKSQKEASNLAQKYNTYNLKGEHALGNFSEAAQLEIDLMNQWRSLFLQMEDTFGNERSELKNDLLTLKDIRDDMKMNLEMNGMPFDGLQCSSDASDHITS